MNTQYLACSGSRDAQIFALHGFGGDGQDFTHLAAHSTFQWNCMDLLGHGKAYPYETPEAYRVEHQLELLAPYLCGDILLGYSMGARLALHTVLQYPKQWKGMVLISGTPGIEEDIQSRILWDRELAHRLQTSTKAEFWEYWSNLPIIKTQQRADAQFLKAQQQRRKKQNLRALSASVLGFGTGTMPSVWSRLSEISIPVLLVVGEDDKKYTEIAIEMKKRMIHVDIFVVLNAGHAPHFEKPQECAQVIDRWISNLLL